MNMVSKGLGVMITACVLGASAFVVGAQEADKMSHPQPLTFTSHQDSHTIDVVVNGKPVPASAIQQAKLWVDKHDYDHMISMTKADGKVTIRPTEHLEQGTYTLEIVTTQGNMRVPFYAPLYNMDQLLAEEAQRLGMTNEELRLRLGISEAPERHHLDLGINPIYYKGQTLNVALSPAQDHKYVWKVNGQLAKEGAGPNEFQYTFDQPGVYNIEYQEMKDGALVARDSRVVRVMDQPAVARRVMVNEEAEFFAPEGFSEYQWMIDDKPVASAPRVVHVFEAPGEHTVMVVAQNPQDGILDKSRTVTYHVVVVPPTGS